MTSVSKKVKPRTPWSKQDKHSCQQYCTQTAYGWGTL